MNVRAVRKRVTGLPKIEMNRLGDAEEVIIYNTDRDKNSNTFPVNGLDQPNNKLEKDEPIIFEWEKKIKKNNLIFTNNLIIK